MKTLIHALILTLALPMAVLAEETMRETSGMTLDEARAIARSPEYAPTTGPYAVGEAGEGELPRTASPFPLLALMGAGALTGAAAVRFARLAR